MNEDLEHRLEEEALADSIRLSPIATVLSNPRLPDNPIIAANSAFCALTGYGEGEIVGRNCRFLAGPNTEPWLTDRIRQSIRDLRPTLTELLNYKKDGAPFRNAVLIAPLFGADGEVAWFLGSQVEVDPGSAAPLALRQQRAAGLASTLSPRQREVLQEMASGQRNKQIAWSLGLSEKTVKMHRALLLDKLGVKTTADAIRLAVEAGL
ncbi:MAG TPA: LuxR C-terminal-related transcriptional regulator [Allosphingosinicella sp.]|nr:LuxR C-terminal-related transcriptional regulator [Allosphingosinicella sp.]